MLRSLDEIQAARKKITLELYRGGLTGQQEATLKGLSTALQWVCHDGGQTLEDLVNGRPVSRLEQAEWGD